jgi:MoxR-like ATPase
MARPVSKHPDDFAAALAHFQEQHTIMLQELGKAIIGQKRVLREMLAAIFCRAHCLLVGVPGLAKTLMVRALSDVLALRFKRIQFTPDLMPSDITGTNVLEDTGGRRRFEFLRGPIFAHVILADEINRTPPKTQAALLEAMQERQVSVGDQTYPLEEPFFVIATQNPIEQEGTYPLPEAQLDRFMFNIHVDYPTADEEEEIIRYITLGTYPRLRALLTREDILRLQDIVGRVMVSDHVIRYASRIVRSTRPKGEEAPKFIRQFVDWGAGPRAGQALIMGGRAMAMMDGRPNVSCQDVRDVATPVLRHRIAPNFQAQAEGIDSVELVRRLLKEVPEPKVEPA